MVSAVHVSVKRKDLASRQVMRGFPRVFFRSETVPTNLIKILTVLGVPVTSGLVDIKVDNLVHDVLFRRVFRFLS